MTDTECACLLSLITVAYPNAFSRLGKADIIAVVKLWHATFETVPFYIMKQALQNHVFKSKFPPTIAEMVQQLRSIYFAADERASIQMRLDLNTQREESLQIMKATAMFTQNIVQLPKFDAEKTAELTLEEYFSTRFLTDDRENSA